MLAASDAVKTDYNNTITIRFGHTLGYVRIRSSIIYIFKYIYIIEFYVRCLSTWFACPNLIVIALL